MCNVLYNYWTWHQVYCSYCVIQAADVCSESATNWLLCWRLRRNIRCWSWTACTWETSQKVGFLPRRRDLWAARVEVRRGTASWSVVRSSRTQWHCWQRSRSPFRLESEWSRRRPVHAGLYTTHTHTRAQNYYISQSATAWVIKPDRAAWRMSEDLYVLRRPHFDTQSNLADDVAAPRESI